MAGIKKRLPASSLIECMVASLILLIVFTLTMDFLLRLNSRTPEADEQLAMAGAVQQTWHELEARGLPEGKYRRVFDWGELQIVLRPYSEGVDRLTLIAVPQRGAKEIKFHFLLKRE